MLIPKAWKESFLFGAERDSRAARRRRRQSCFAITTTSQQKETLREQTSSTLLAQFPKWHRETRWKSADLEALLAESRKKLYEAREKRVKPDRDEKILTAWNGMMLASFAEAGAILERDDYTDVAKRNARFVLETLRNDGLLLRTYKDGVAKLNGYLEDYAFLSEGLLTLYETTGDLEWLQECLHGDRENGRGVLG